MDGGKLEGGFQFNVKGLAFVSTQYDWLAVEGTRAQLTGTGKIGDKTGYSFMLIAAKGPDAIRLRIWETATGVVVYDSMPGAADNTLPNTPVERGSLKIAP